MGSGQSIPAELLGPRGFELAGAAVASGRTTPHGTAPHPLSGTPDVLTVVASFSEPHVVWAMRSVCSAWRSWSTLLTASWSVPFVVCRVAHYTYQGIFRFHPCPHVTVLRDAESVVMERRVQTGKATIHTLVDGDAQRVAAAVVRSFLNRHEANDVTKMPRMPFLLVVSDAPPVAKRLLLESQRHEVMQRLAQLSLTDALDAHLPGPSGSDDSAAASIDQYSCAHRRFSVAFVDVRRAHDHFREGDWEGNLRRYFDSAAPLTPGRDETATGLELRLVKRAVVDAVLAGRDSFNATRVPYLSDADNQPLDGKFYAASAAALLVGRQLFGAFYGDRSASSTPAESPPSTGSGAAQPPPPCQGPHRDAMTDDLLSPFDADFARRYRQGAISPAISMNARDNSAAEVCGSRPNPRLVRVLSQNDVAEASRIVSGWWSTGPQTTQPEVLLLVNPDGGHALSHMHQLVKLLGADARLRVGYDRLMSPVKVTAEAMENYIVLEPAPNLYVADDDVLEFNSSELFTRPCPFAEAAPWEQWASGLPEHQGAAAERIAARPWLLWGGIDTFSSAHVEPHSTAVWVHLLFGKKEWFIRHHDHDGTDGGTSWSTFHQEPGQTVVMPPGVVHIARNACRNATIAVARNFYPMVSLH